jgi:tetratricopeptide (TPR) repeat protein
MLNRIIKIAIILGMITWAAWQYAEGNIGNGIFLNILTAVPIFLLFRHELILWAFWQIRKNRMDKAKEILDKIKKPNQLLKRQEAYFYFLKGLTESQTGGFGKSETYFKKALSTGLRMKQDQALANLNLAGIAMSKRRKREAINYMNQAKKLDKAGLLDEQIRMFKKQLGRV